MKQSESGRILKRIFHCIRPHAPLVGLSLLMAVLSVTGTLYLPILTGRVIDGILGKGRVEFAAILPILARMAAVIALTAAAQWIMNLVNNRIVYRISGELREQAFQKIQILPLSYLDAHASGDLLSRVIADVDQFTDGLLLGFTQLFTGVVTILGTLFFMLSVNVWITLVVVVLTPLSLLAADFIAKRTYRMFRAQSEIRGEQTALVNEMIENQKVVQAYSQEAATQERFDEINGRLSEASRSAVFFSSLTNPCTRFVNGLVYAAVGLFGALAVVNSALTVGGLSAFLSYANQYSKPFNDISGVVTEMQNALACAGRIFDLTDAGEEEPDPAQEKALPENPGEVRIDHVYFSYDKEKSLIEDFNLCARRGERIALVGPTGCGKTTMINLLLRFYDADQGCIRIEGNDILALSREELRGAFGMVLQDTWLRSGTILENIALGKPDASREEIMGAAREAHADSFIRRLPDGYDTEIGESGGCLSAGEKQLLCIARVMLTLPPMLILDEATSSIDTRTELQIQNAFEKLMQGRTSFIVAHRLSTIVHADLILVMRAGRIVEQGTHEELLRKGGFYAGLYNSQFAGGAVVESQEREYDRRRKQEDGTDKKRRKA